MENKFYLIDRRGTTSLATTLLVLLVLLLVSSSLFYFTIYSNNTSKKISNSLEISKVYERQKIVDFYIQDILDKSSEGIKSDEELVSEFKRQLNFYKNPPEGFLVEELSQVESQLDNLKLIKENGIPKSSEFEIEIIIKKSFKENEENKFNIEYNYDKKFIANV